MLFALFAMSTSYACIVDAWEDNDTYSTAYDLGTTYDWTAVSTVNMVTLDPVGVDASDPDWYGFHMAGATYHLTVTADAPVQVSVYKNVQGQPSPNGVFTNVGTSTNVQPIFGAAGQSFFVKVTSADGCANYSMSISAPLDSDKDGEPDSSDNCPDDYNPTQKDVNGNGVGDACDTVCEVNTCSATGDGVCSEDIVVGSGEIEVHRTHPLDDTHECVDRLVVHLHEAAPAEPWLGVETLRELAELNGVDANTAVVAPRFEVMGNGGCAITAGACELGRHHWLLHDWELGNEGGVPNGLPSLIDPGVSSFDVIDEIVAQSQLAYPNLTEVVVVGHQEGGQATQRFGISSFDIGLTGLDVRFVPVNASAFMRLGPQGLPPAPPPGPSVFLQYPYGFFSRSGTPYFTFLGNSTSALPGSNAYVAQALDRDFVYVVGEDNDCACNAGCQFGGTMDCSSSANAQGLSRVDRTWGMLDHMDLQYGTTGHYHEVLEVPDVDHDMPLTYGCGETPEVLLGLAGAATLSTCP